MSDRFYVKGARIKDKCNPDELLVIGDVCDLLNELNNKNKELREELRLAQN